MTFAYADPPYVGQSRKLYGGAEVNHRLLVAYLGEFDAWALSCSSPSLRDVLALCPLDVRVGAWVKPFASFKPGVNPAYAWEPVVFSGGRRMGRDELTVRDWHSENITLQRGLSGVKPESFCFWLFALLGARVGDAFTDVFPGSGAVGDAWQRYQRMRRLPLDVA